MAARKKSVKKPDKKRTASSAKTKAAEADPLLGPPPERTKCTGKTAAGKPCPRWALDGAHLCARHIRAGRGRPSKLDAQVIDQIVTILAEGGYAETAALAAGISKSTFHEWMARGDPAGTNKTDAPFRDFRAKVEEARAKGEVVKVQQIAAAAGDDWRAAAWMLEREHPDRWGGPRSRNVSRGIHPDDFAAGEPSTPSPDSVVDDQLRRDGSPL